MNYSPYDPPVTGPRPPQGPAGVSRPGSVNQSLIRLLNNVSDILEGKKVISYGKPGNSKTEVKVYTRNDR